MAHRQDIPGLYVLKALCALFVVIIHIPIAGKELLAPVIRIAVPCFYMISGYFLFSGTAEKEILKAWRWAKKAFILAFAINLFYFTVNGILSGADIRSFLLSFATGDTIAAHLWYLTALWQALLLFVIIRKWLPAYVIKFAPLLCLINLLLGRYLFIFDDGTYSLHQFMRLNCVSVALPYICLGYLLRLHNNALKGKLQRLILLLLSVILIYAEEYILSIHSVNNKVSFSLFTLPLSASCFLIFLNEIRKAPSFIIDIGKKHSANTYYFHIFINTVLCILFGRELFSINNTCIQALAVFIVCIYFSYSLYFIHTKLILFINCKRINQQ